MLSVCRPVSLAGLVAKSLSLWEGSLVLLAHFLVAGFGTSQEKVSNVDAGVKYVVGVVCFHFSFWSLWRTSYLPDTIVTGARCGAHGIGVERT